MNYLDIDISALIADTEERLFTSPYNIDYLNKTRLTKTGCLPVIRNSPVNVYTVGEARQARDELGTDVCWSTGLQVRLVTR
jgi:hypothetical protein